MTMNHAALFVGGITGIGTGLLILSHVLNDHETTGKKLLYSIMYAALLTAGGADALLFLLSGSM